MRTINAATGRSLKHPSALLHVSQYWQSFTAPLPPSLRGSDQTDTRLGLTERGWHELVVHRL